MDDSMMQSLSSSSDQGKLLTVPPSRQSSTFYPGDIIVGAPSPSYPNGILRKVISASKVGNQILMETEEATLEEAIETGQLHFSKTLLLQDVQSVKPMKEGVMLKSQSLGPGEMETPSIQGLEFLLFDVILYDGDGDLRTKDDQIRANGKISMDPKVNFYMKIKDFKLKRLIFTEKITERTELTLTSRFTLLEIKKSVEIAKIQFAPITVNVGIVPIVFVPILTVNVGIDGSISAGITTSVIQEANFTAGVSYDSGQWTPISSFDNRFEFIPPKIFSKADLKGYVEPDMSLLLYGIAGPYAAVQGYLELEMDLLGNPCWELYAGLDADVGVRIKVLSKKIADYQLADIISYRVLLGQSDPSSCNNRGS